MAQGEQIGVYDCWSCKKEVPVKKKESGKLSAACGWCDFPHYANAGTEHFNSLLASTRLHAKPATAKPIPDFDSLASPPPPEPPEPVKAKQSATSFLNPLRGKA